eukprot:jgi/Chlat1/2195/Chrsp17S02857
MSKRKKPESIALLAAYDDDSEGEEGQEREAAQQPEDTEVEHRAGEGVVEPHRDEVQEVSAAALPTPLATTPASIRSGGILGIADYEGEGLSPDAEGDNEGFGRAILAEDEPPSTPQVFANHPVDAAPKVGLTPPPMDGTPLRQGESSTPASPTNNWLLPPPPGKCDPKLQGLIVKFLDIKERKHILINTELRRSKAYRNPDFLSHAVETFEIDELGTQLPKDKFDPRGMDPADFYDTLAAEQRREAERKEAQRKPATRVEFVQGGIQRTAVGVPATLSGTETRPAVGMPRLSAQTASGGSAAGDTVAAGAKAAVAASKKSKWDKVDSSRPPLPASAPAASNYASYALQKRKEAEERAKSQKRH